MDRRAALAATITVFFWASAFVAIRDLADTFTAGPLALGRLTIGSVLLGILVWRRGWQRLGRRELGLVALSGVLWFALYSVALNEAERTIDAGTASMLINTAPIFIAIFAAVVLGEERPRHLVAGLGVAFAGSVVIGFATSGQGSATAPSVIGIVLCLVAAVAYSIAVILQKPVLRTISALQVTWLACFSGWIVCLPFLPGLWSELVAATATNDGLTKIGWLAYLGVFPTSLAITTFAYALRRTSAARLGVTTYLVPPVAIGLAWTLLGEAPPPLALLGGVLCIAGVAVVRGLPVARPAVAPASQAR
jgi:drug/metabolite transporter (DMT)-like permease